MAKSWQSAGGKSGNLCRAQRTTSFGPNRFKARIYLITMRCGTITFQVSSEQLLSTPGQHPNAPLTTFGRVETRRNPIATGGFSS